MLPIHEPFYNRYTYSNHYNWYTSTTFPFGYMEQLELRLVFEWETTMLNI